MIEENITEIIQIAKENKVDILLSFCPGLTTSPNSLLEGFHPVTLTCPAGKTEFTVLSNGDVFPCMNLKNNKELYSGNILINSIDEIWNHNNMKQFRSISPADYTGECGNCERKWTCYSARCVAYNLSNDINGDDLSCYLIREKMDINV